MRLATRNLQPGVQERVHQRSYPRGVSFLQVGDLGRTFVLDIRAAVLTNLKSSITSKAT
jgi:hypothetical protein